MSSKASITVLRPRDEVQRLWQSPKYRPDYIEGADAAVRFVDAPGDRGTEIHVELEDAPGGKLGEIVQKLMGSEPLAKAKDDLRRFKQLVETGEIARSEGRPRASGRRASSSSAPRSPLEHVRASRRSESDASERLVGPQHRAGRERPGPEDPQRSRRDREDHLHRDLRLRPAPLRRLHPHDGEGRHPRPRVHGRGRRERPGRRQPARSATAWSCRSRSPAATAAACRHELYSVCENSNPNAGMAEKMFGHPTAGIFGYSHLTGGYAGGQAEYARVPFADVGPIKIEDDLTDEQVLFLSDIFPTGLHGRRDVPSISGGEGRSPCSARARSASSRSRAPVMLGAEQVIAIDQYDYRLRDGAQARPGPPTRSTSPRTPTSSSSSRS